MLLTPTTASLPEIALITGLLTAVPAGFALIAPASAEKWFKKFPRSVWPGRVIMALCVVWAVAWLVIMPFDFLKVLHPYLWIIMPLFIAGTWFFMPELLSCRAFGCLIALAATPMLSSAQWHPSLMRYFVIVYAYVLAVAGMFYIALPYLVRDHITWTFAGPARTRAVSAAFAVLGFILIFGYWGFGE